MNNPQWLVTGICAILAILGMIALRAEFRNPCRQMQWTHARLQMERAKYQGSVILLVIIFGSIGVAGFVIFRGMH